MCLQYLHFDFHARLNFACIARNFWGQSECVCFGAAVAGRAHKGAGRPSFKSKVSMAEKPARDSPDGACGLEEILYRLGGPLRLLGRPVRACEPCIGIGGLRRLVLAAGGQYEATAAYDVDTDLQHFYASLRRHEFGAAAAGLDTVHTGPEDGDLLKLRREEMESCEMLVGGPPCQPWSSSGEKGGCNDPRSEVMDETVNMIIEQAWRGQLCLVVLENSSRLLGTEYLAEIMRRLEISVPFFKWDAHKSDLCEVFPQSRERLWLRGMRLDALCAAEIPEPLQPHDLAAGSRWTHCWMKRQSG